MTGRKMQNIIIKPIITEKSMRDAALGKFTFVVAKMANKTAIKKKIEEQFKVNVVAVSTSIVKGGRKRVGKRMAEKILSSWKKAIVKLKKDQKIALFDTGGK